MQGIEADVKTVRKLLDKTKYQIDFFQREYKWERRHIEQLISDLESKFSLEYDESDSRADGKRYSRYYMGSIITSTKNGKQSIIDGQQRLTSITLLLIYLKNLQQENGKGENELVDIDTMILSKTYGEQSYNLDIPDRKDCMNALYNEKPFNDQDAKESVKNIMRAYQDIDELFPSGLKEDRLAYFIDWLTEKVTFVEIRTTSDDDAYAVFETMNDRGLSLTATEMLKGYLLSKMDKDEDKSELNDIWKLTITKIGDVRKDEGSEFFKSWLRGKYAETIRAGKKDAENEDFEKISTRFHDWVRGNEDRLGLVEKSKFRDFIKHEFVFYSKWYLKISKAADNFDEELEYVYYIAELGVAPSFYYPMLMSPISRDDDEVMIKKKINLAARFLETFYIFRKINSKTTSYSSIRYNIFNIVKQIRNQDLHQLVSILKEDVEAFEEKLDGIIKYEMKGNRKKYVRYLLARITSHIEQNTGKGNSFEKYVSKQSKNQFTIEHLWADKMEHHLDEFQDKYDFEEWRNKFGALVLIPEDFNRSYGASTYEEKIKYYNSQNLLAWSLNSQCYEHNPSFVQYVRDSNLPFKPYKEFKKEHIEERQKLYQKICEEIWHVDGFDKIANSS